MAVPMLHAVAAPALHHPDSHTSARAAHLHYVRDDRPGIRRKAVGKTFGYTGPDGKRVRDAATLERIRRLAIPPAYTDVWISPDPRGHIQATGRDVRGRKQYRYHPDWRSVRDETKFERMLAFSEALPRIRAQVAKDLDLPGLPRDKVLATVVALLERTRIRVGNDEYARTNGSFGLTTLHDDHVRIRDGVLRFAFRAKSGKTHRVELHDRRLAKIVRRCRDIPGEELFQFIADDGSHQTIDSGDVNNYLRTVSGEDFSAKDFRTWAGTMMAVEALETLGDGRTAHETKRNVLAAIDRVCERLNNTRSVCRKYYVHPAVCEHYVSGTLLVQISKALSTPAPKSRKKIPYALDARESAVIELIRAGATQTARTSRARRATG